MNKVFTAIYNKFNNNVAHGAYTSVGGRFYLNVAPQGATFPYVVFFSVADANEYDTSDETEDITIQFNIFSQNNSVLEAGQILTNLKSLFDNCSLTVTNWRHLEMRRRNTYPNNDYEQSPPIVGYSVEYDILIEKTRS